MTLSEVLWQDITSQAIYKHIKPKSSLNTMNITVDYASHNNMQLWFFKTYNFDFKDLPLII